MEAVVVPELIALMLGPDRVFLGKLILIRIHPLPTLSAFNRRYIVRV
jgi:hypothetical protein